jgi:hypothetical protein
VTDSRCIPIEELARVRELPEGSAERSHAGSCPRCRAALLALAEFERGGDLPAEAGALVANARLDEVIDALTSPVSVAAPRAAAPRREPGWLARFLAPPAMRFATGLAAVVVVVAAVWLSGRAPSVPGTGDDRVVRGEEQAPAKAGVRAVPAGWEIDWPAVEGADSYEVVLLDPELREVARVAGVRETRLVLTRDSLPAGVTTGVPLLLEIQPRSGRGVLEASVPVAIELR